MTRLPLRLFRGTAVALAVVALVAGCSRGGGGAAGTGEPVAARTPVVATTTVFADFVSQIGGDRVTVTSLVPKGGEVHTFDPTPQDLGRVEDAKVVFANGLGLDEWLTKLARDAGATAEVVHLAETLPQSDRILESGIPNPHLWLDPALAAGYGRAIADALGRADPAGAPTFRANADAWATKMATLETDLKHELEAIPANRRQIVSFHDALPYFARAFGFEIVGSIIKAPGQDPSAGELADLVAGIRQTKAKLVVSEVQFSDQLAKTVADEAGVTVISDLYTDTLGDPPVDSYEALMRWDIDRLLKGYQAAGQHGG